MKVKPIAGVYMIRCKVNQKVYIGCSGDIKRRWVAHKCQQSNKFLQSDFIKYGLENFEFTILEVCPDKWEAEKRELHYMKLYKCERRECGYNIKSSMYDY